MAVIISNPEGFEKKKKIFVKEGLKKIHILSDFDRTLTRCFDESGKKVISIMHHFREKKYISEDYARKAQELFDKYHPIEIDNKISLEEKKKAMLRWWGEHFKLLIDSGLNKKILDDFAKNTNIYFREGVLDFLDLLNEKNIPLVIISSSGFGTLIPEFFRKENKLYSNIFSISNVFEFNEKGEVVKIKEPIIHSLNKKEASLPENVLEKVLNRKNVILLGDGLEDVQMISGFEYDNLIKIGFLNEGVEENLEGFKKAYDVVIIGDGDFGFVNSFMREICG